MTKKELLHIAESYFETQGWKAFPFQKQTWDAFLSGKNGLLNAPTGSGKTYALWVGIVLSYIKSNPDYKTKNKKGLKAIWITPLRSLSQEIAQTSQKFVDGIGLPFTVGIRSGDTTTKERAAQKKAMPDLLITTPESLHLLLATKDHVNVFKDCNAIIIDEWHELLGTKRGVQMELGLSRLSGINKNLRIWGISATIGNLEQARQVLLGVDSYRYDNSVLIKANLKKEIEVRSIIPETMEKFPWRGHLGLHLLEDVVKIINESKSTLIFTNTRAQCELWFQALMHKHPEFAGEVAMHHGSINKETRIWVENAIRNESLKACICTSSLDLGVDFAPVETIIQVGSPKGVARFLQRAGRSGHRPGVTSVIYFLPTHALELIEASALQVAVKTQAVEDRLPYLNCYDVLIQYLCTLAVSGGFYPDHIYPEVKATFCYQELTYEEFEWCLHFIVYGSASLESYDEYKKVSIDEDGRYFINDRGIAMRHRLQMGTIVTGTSITVKYATGGYIGSIEEYFISQLSRGDVFVFAGRTLEFVRLKGMVAQVRNSSKKKAKVTSWMGSRMPLTSQLGELLREEMQHFQSGKKRTPEVKALKDIINRQQQESIVPQNHEFLIETFKTREGYHSVFYPFEGRLVHMAMAGLLAYRMSLLQPISFTLAYNDYGFEILSDQEFDMQNVLDNNLITSDMILEDLEASVNATELAKRKFRDIAVISGLVFTGYPNKAVKVKHLQSSSQLLFEVFRDNEPDNLLYRQAYTETYEQEIEEYRLREAFERIENQTIVWKACKQPTPFSFPIITDRLREKLSSEKLADRIKRMQIKWE
ncbi:MULTISPECIES: ligase-associated DNA damage response DEXH box helicase [Nonlabens]|uniref:ATP-dependent Lhr-like helicase n=1 Tax=Nonlabens xylanidelens TaxID=191564 RepID=A0A2S6ISB3_9FLAO|nr:ligase-associated DNA damage response DEXH box helicase [Nonlabens xylanidelens]PPK96926.1 ATP-dependent Lhr-like helicase [Nonlabens xylanidelens]PQJ13624.1 DNA ligase-associated DEXH box helicase [Nonlabens xylanidelens]